MRPLLSTKKAQTDKDLHPLISERWSPRTFDEKALSEATISRLFEAARWAPSSNNWQPWRFIYAQKGDKAYDRIFDLLAPFNQGWAGNAPVLALAIIDKKRPDGLDNFHALHDLGLAVSLLTVQAQSEDIAVHQMAGVDFEQAAKEFSLPENHHVVSCIAIGYYGGVVGDLPEDLQEMEMKARSRKPLSEILGNGTFPGA